MKVLICCLLGFGWLACRFFAWALVRVSKVGAQDFWNFKARKEDSLG